MCRVKDNALFNLILFLFYKVSLDVIYYFFIADIFTYEGYYADFNLVRLIFSYILVVFSYITLPKSVNKLSSIIIWMLNLISFVPMTTYYSFTDANTQFMFAVAFFWIFVNLAIGKFPNITFEIRIKSEDSNKIFIFLCLVLSLYVIVMLYINFGIKINFDLSKVYDIRSQYNKIKFPFSGYFVNWLAYIIYPILFSIFIVEKKVVKALFVVLLQLYLFFISGMKAFLFAPAFVFCLMWIVTRKNPFAYMILGLVGAIMIGILSYSFFNNILVLSLFCRRTLFVPARLYFIYEDYFSKHSIILLSHSIFKGIFNYPYDLNPVNLIGYVYFGRAAMSANTGIVGDAYMNFGYAGLVFWGILLIIILKIVDCCAKGLDKRISIAAMAMPVIALTNSALLTSLLTHGILLSTFILYLLPRDSHLID